MRPKTGELDDAGEAMAERVRRSNARVFATYLVVQAVVGLAFWVGLAVSDEVRELFELVPEVRSVTSAWLFADLIVGVLGSALGAYALWADARWALPVIAFTTGGIVYPTIMLATWVLMEDTGLPTLAIMVPPSVISLYVTSWTWRNPGERRSVARPDGGYVTGPRQTIPKDSGADSTKPYRA